MGKVRWQIMSSEDKDFILQEAILRGWAEKQVQVRTHREGNRVIWSIEPHEQDCGCSNIVQYDPKLIENRP